MGRLSLRASVGLLSLLLLALQCGLFLVPQSGSLHVAKTEGLQQQQRGEALAVPIATDTQTVLQQLLQATGEGAAAVAGEGASDESQQGASAPGNSTQSKKACSGETDAFPRNRILIIHEQHLQSMGCDVRLLRFVKDLLYLNQEVSMMFRGSTPSKMRQPKSKQLAAILHIENFEDDQLRKGLRQPPGLYEWTSAERFAQLMAMGYFNVVIIFLWFWYDPQPSVAELVLPLLRAHAPPDKQPFVALLSDDAHSIRCVGSRHARRRPPMHGVACRARALASGPTSATTHHAAAAAMRTLP